MLLLLAGCAGSLGQLGTDRGITLGGGFRIIGPTGYCALAGTKQRRAGSDFVALTGCAASGGAATVSRPIMTATIGASGSAAEVDLTPERLIPFFQSAEGRAVLSRSGDPGSVTVQDVQSYGGGVIIRLTDQSDDLPNALESGQSWRAVAGMGGRLVTLSLQARKSEPIGAGEGISLMRRFVDAMRQANQS
jgi:hypothetical protein